MKMAYDKNIAAIHLFFPSIPRRFVGIEEPCTLRLQLGANLTSITERENPFPQIQ